MIEFVLTLIHDDEDADTIDELEMIVDKEFDRFAEGLMQDHNNLWCANVDDYINREEGYDDLEEELD